MPYAVAGGGPRSKLAVNSTTRKGIAGAAIAAGTIGCRRGRVKKGKLGSTEDCTTKWHN